MNYMKYFIVLLLIISISFAQTPIDSCTTISSSGQYYLTQNLSSTSACITIAANNTEIDCQGYTITATSSSGRGILTNNYISNVIIRNCKFIGEITSFNTNIYLNYPYNISIYNNTFSTSYISIYSYNKQNAYVYIYNNSFLSGQFGINPYAASYFYILNNSFNTYNSYAIMFDSSTSYPNFIFNNIFNTSNSYLYTASITNYWNTTLTEATNIVGGPYIGGNYWGKPNSNGFSDTCIDNDYNGICDSSFTLTGTNIDYLPLAKYIPNNPPLLEILTENNTIFNDNINIEFQVNTDSDYSNCSLYLNSQYEDSLIATNGTYNFELNLENGVYEYYISCTDSNNKVNTSEIFNFVFDNQNPIINTSFSNNQYLKEFVGFIEIEDLTFNSALLKIYLNEVNIENVSLNESNNINISLEDGIYDIEIIAFDSFSNTTIDIYNITIDSINPQISINNPVSNEIYSTFNIPLSIQCDDLNFDRIEVIGIDLNGTISYNYSFINNIVNTYSYLYNSIFNFTIKCYDKSENYIEENITNIIIDYTFNPIQFGCEIPSTIKTDVLDVACLSYSNVYCDLIDNESNIIDSKSLEYNQYYYTSFNITDIDCGKIICSNNESLSIKSFCKVKDYSNEILKINESVQSINANIENQKIELINVFLFSIGIISILIFTLYHKSLILMFISFFIFLYLFTIFTGFISITMMLFALLSAVLMIKYVLE